jgi:site-specific DNA-methyltransferase (adenine-specific)
MSDEIKKKIMLDLHNIDCMELMAQYPDQYFDLAVVDPPYGIDYNMNAGRKKGEKERYHKKAWDKTHPEKCYFIELQRVAKNAIIWGGDYMLSNISFTPNWIIWDKMVPNGVSFSDFEMAATTFSGAKKIFRHCYSGFQGREKVRIHPTQKPVSLYKWLLQHYAKEGDKILDTHLGSGSIAIACHDMGYDLTGSELDPDYFAAMQQRIAQHQSQLTLKI